jgi:hypothetical protein
MRGKYLGVLAVVTALTAAALFIVDQLNSQPSDDLEMLVLPVGATDASGAWTLVLSTVKDVRFDGSTQAAAHALESGISVNASTVRTEQENNPGFDLNVVEWYGLHEFDDDELGDLSVCVALSAAAFTIEPDGSEFCVDDRLAESPFVESARWSFAPVSGTSGTQAAIYSIVVSDRSGETVLTMAVPVEIDVRKPFLDRYPIVFTGFVALLGALLTAGVTLVLHLLDRRHKKRMASAQPAATPSDVWQGLADGDA